MRQITVKNVSEIEADERRWLERVLGSELQESQQVFILVFTPDVVPDAAVRLRAAESIRQTIAKARENADAQGLTDDEIDAAVDEAMRAVRRREP